MIKWNDRRAFDRATFRHRFNTPEKVTELVTLCGRQADERLPGLYEQRKLQQANVEVLKIVGGEPLESARCALWQMADDIEYHELWQMLRDCLAAKLVRVEITALFVQFEAAGYHNRRRICRFGPHVGLEFGETGQRRQLTTLAKTARAVLQRRSAKGGAVVGTGAAGPDR